MGQGAGIEQGDSVAAPPQLDGGRQPIDAGPGHDHALFLHSTPAATSAAARTGSVAGVWVTTHSRKGSSSKPLMVVVNGSECFPSCWAHSTTSGSLITTPETTTPCRAAETASRRAAKFTVDPK